MTRARSVPIALMLLAAACSAPKLPPPLEKSSPPDSVAAQEFPVQVRVERHSLTCRAATRAAKTALRRMGYVVETILTPEPGITGEIRAHRNTGWRAGYAGDAYDAAVRLTCDDRGAVMIAATEEGLSERMTFRRDFPLEVDRAIAITVRRREPVSRQVETKLKVLVEPLRGTAAAEITGGTPETLGVTPIRIQIQNQTALLYRLEVERFNLISEEGDRNRPMSADRVASKVPPEWRDRVRKQQLSDGDIKPGGTVGGYIYVPAAAYRRAKVVLIEAESEEAEGFSVEF